MPKNNELETLGLFSECILPSMDILHFGGSSSGIPDLLVVDRDDENLSSFTTAPKANYIVSGQKLFLVHDGLDPWNMKKAMTGVGMNVKPVYEREVMITKRPAGAVRHNNNNKFLALYDHRLVSMALRFWVEYPKDSFLDLTDYDHLDSIFNTVLKVKREQGYAPHITIDAKLNEEAQCVGPNLRATLTDGQWAGIHGTNMKPEWLEYIDYRLKGDIMEYMTKLNITDTNYKVVSSEKLELGKNEVYEHRYNATKFNHVMSDTKFGLASVTFSKPVKIPSTEKITNDILCSGPNGHDSNEGS